MINFCIEFGLHASLKLMIEITFEEVAMIFFIYLIVGSINDMMALIQSGRF